MIPTPQFHPGYADLPIGAFDFLRRVVLGTVVAAGLQTVLVTYSCRRVSPRLSSRFVVHRIDGLIQFRGTTQVERDFGQAVLKNDAETVGQFLTDDWIIIDPDGGVIDKARFLGVIKSGALTDEQMDSDDVRIRIYGDTAIATALTRTKGKFMGQDFTTQERATDVLVKKNSRWWIVFSQLTRFSKK